MKNEKRKAKHIIIGTPQPDDCPLCRAAAEAEAAGRDLSFDEFLKLAEESGGAIIPIVINDFSPLDN